MKKFTEEVVRILEVRPKNPGFYYVHVYWYERKKYKRQWLKFDGKIWHYNYGKKCYVCFVFANDKNGKRYDFAILKPISDNRSHNKMGT
jgi:hypothetical protein